MPLEERVMRKILAAIGALFGIAAYTMLMCALYYGEERLGFMAAATTIFGTLIGLAAVTP
jgi:hypothetical protein